MASHTHVQAMVQHTLTEAYKRDLLGQIQGRIEAARAERQSYLEEGRRMRQAQAQEKAVLEHIKAAKLAELAAEGVPGKYVGELARMRITGAK
jgi:Trichohyalin-plectin-homology domain